MPAHRNIAASGPRSTRACPVAETRSLASRMSVAISGAAGPACRYAHAGYDSEFVTRACHIRTVIARLDRAIQYAEAAVIDPRSCGVLDSPLSRGMTPEAERRSRPSEQTAPIDWLAGFRQD